MTKERRITLTKILFEDSLKMIDKKGDAYSGKKDSLNNFKKNAANLNMTKYQIWAVYFNKHIDAINNAIAENPENPIEKTESLRGRIVDAITYLSILECLKKEIFIKN